MAILGILIVLIGILNTAFPYFFWMLRDGWRYKNAEPSELALLMSRLGGILFVLAGIYIVFLK